MSDITSGLGIGGHGSDDHNINLPEPTIPEQPPVKKLLRFGAAGLRYDEACDTCGKETVVCNDCGRCERHCKCYQR